MHNVAKRSLYSWLKFFISDIQDNLLFFLAKNKHHGGAFVFIALLHWAISKKKSKFWSQNLPLEGGTKYLFKLFWDEFLCKF